MKIASDPERRLHLDGAGVVERPLEVTPELTGWPAPTARAYQYRAGQAIPGDSAGDEMVMLLLRGDIDLEADGEIARCTRADPFADGPVVLYLPPGRSYRAAVRADSLVLYCRAPATGARPTRILRPGGGEVLGAGDAEHLRIREQRVGAGRWSAPAPGGEPRAIAYHHFSGPDGWALRPERRDTDRPHAATVLHDGDALVGPLGDEPLVAGPGADLLVVIVAAV